MEKNNEININDLSEPLVVSYENNLQNNNNSLLYKKTLEKCNWQYIFIGENIKWTGVKDKIINYYNYLKNLPESKVVILTDARDVFCLRSSTTFLDHIKDIINSNKIIISAEMFLLGHLDWSDDQISKKGSSNFWQGINLDKYWSYYNKLENLPLRKYVNSGLIVGKAKELKNAFKWIIDNNYTDDQLGFSNYLNNFPELVYLDYETHILHSSTFGVDGGIYDVEKQKYDSPTFAELLGMSSYFLHIPGIGNKGQKKIYSIIYNLINNEIFTLKDEMYSLYGIKKSKFFQENYYEKNKR